MDLVESNTKPKIKIKKNSFYTTFDYEIARQSPNIEVIEKLPFRASGKNIWIVRALIDLEAEIVGAPSVSQQIQIIKRLSRLPIDEVIIDGALDRKSIIGSGIIDKTYLLAGASFGDVKHLKNELQRLFFLSNIEVFTTKKISLDEIVSSDFNNNIQKIKSILGYEKEFIQADFPKNSTLFLEGAITDKSYKIIADHLAIKRFILIFKHSINIHLNLNNLQNLIKKNKIYTLSPISITGIYLNSFSPRGTHLDADIFREEIRNFIPQIPVMDVMELA